MSIRVNLHALQLISGANTLQKIIILKTRTQKLSTSLQLYLNKFCYIGCTIESLTQTKYFIKNRSHSFHLTEHRCAGVSRGN